MAKSKSNSELADERSKGEEIAVRQADSNSSSKFVKDYVVFKLPGDAEEDHENYINATRQEALNHGLRPSGDVKFDGQKDHSDENTYVLTFSVPVELASDADQPYEVKHAAADEEVQHEVLEK